MSPPRALLTDFGLAKDTATGSRLTRTGVTLGTPQYMSPELARGATSALTPASDVWALGCVLYECVAGRRAFDGPGTAEVIGAVLTGPPPPLDRATRGIPDGLRQLILGCLVTDAGRRPQDAAALRDDCVRVLAGERPRARAGVGVGRRWAAGALGAALVAAMAGGIAWRATRPAAPPPANVPDPVTRAAEDAWAQRSLDPARAANGLEAALAQRPDRHDWRLRLGQLRWVCGHAPEALATWAAIPPDAPDRQRADWLSGLAQMARDLADESARGHAAVRAHWEQAARGAAPLSDLARAGLALLAQDFPAAADLLRGQTSWDAAVVEAVALAHTKNPHRDAAAAVRAYDRVIADGLAPSWVYNNRGYLYVELGDDQRAGLDFDRALALDPRDTSAWLNRAALRERAGDLSGAHADLERLLAISPGDPLAVRQRGRVHLRGGDLRAALADFDEALRSRPNFAGALFDRAQVRRQLGDAPGAVADYDRALALLPNVAAGYYNRGVAREALGDRDGARTDYDRAVQLDPRHTRAWCNRGRLRDLAGDATGALADFDRALALDPGDAHTRVLRGYCRQRAGDLAGAEADFLAVQRSSPTYAEAHAGLGGLRMAQGRWKEAAVGLRRFLELAPNHRGAPKLREVLAECEARAAAAGD